MVPKVILGTVPRTDRWYKGRDKFGLTGNELLSHVWMPGLTGAGKTSLLVSWVIQLFKQGIGCTIIDPSGKAVEDILAHLIQAGFYKTNPNAYDEVLWIEPGDSPPYFPLDPLHQPFLSESQTIKFVLEAMHRIWPALAENAPMFDRVMQHSLRLLMDNKADFTQMIKIFNMSKSERKPYIAKITDDQTVDFWERLWNETSIHDHLTYMGTAATRFDLLMLSEAFRYSFGQVGQNVLNPRTAMDQSKLVLIPLHKLDHYTKPFFGSLFSHQYEVAVTTRAPRTDLPPHFLFMDEFWQFVSKSGQSIAEMLTSSRQWGLFAVMAHQDIAQISAHEQLIGAMQNAAVCVGFKHGDQDAEVNARRFGDFGAYADPNQTPLKPIGAGGTATDHYSTVATHLKTLPDFHALVRYKERPAIEIETLKPPKIDVAQDQIDLVKKEYLRRYATPRDQINQPAPPSGGGGTPPNPKPPRVKT